MPAFLVLSDIHANLQALQAVFNHAQSNNRRPDAIWCLGDIVGYGPQPGECIDQLQATSARFGNAKVYCIRGNHDQGVVNEDRNLKQEGAKQVLDSWKWTAGVLTAKQKEYLANLPTSLVFTDLPRSVRLVHAAPPESMEHYMLVAKHVEDLLDVCPEQLCFFGHTHLACYFECDLSRREARPRLFPLQGAPEPYSPPGQDGAIKPRRFLPAETTAPAESKASKLFVNPGSVGQPRWGRVLETIPAHERHSPYPVAYLGLREASYLWVEIEAASVRLWIHYVEYDVSETIRRMAAIKDFELPNRWVARLSDGLR